MKSAKKMKKGLTIVEVLVVIAIIGVLAAVLMGTFSGGTESARAAKCLTNMRNLAAACQSYGMASGYYPTAGSYEAKNVDDGTTQWHYGEHRGWIGWNSQGAYSGTKRQSIHNSAWHTTAYTRDEVARTYVLTNSALWKYVSCNSDVYRCPEHARKKKDPSPNWSYVMNAYFGWDRLKKAKIGGYAHRYGHLKRADRRLLFAELPFAGIGEDAPTDESGELTDSVLQYAGCPGCGSAESIGFNHKSGKRNAFAHVCFADGHVEKLAYNKSMSAKDMQNLTKWLCQGKDITFSGKKYELMSGSSDSDDGSDDEVVE